jgi:hypothetical protein
VAILQQVAAVAVGEQLVITAVQEAEEKLEILDKLETLELQTLDQAAADLEMLQIILEDLADQE